MPRNHTTLTTLYALYEQWAVAFAFACRKGCATCCTRSVTMTTAEGELILEYIGTTRPELHSLLAELPVDVPVPGATTNQFAAACLRGEETGETNDPWDLRPCGFLLEGCCAIYPVRPFMCRSFGSRISCALQGEAVVEPLFLTLNTVVMQVIEHLDRGRPWGNMNTLLRSLAAGSDRKSNENPEPGLVAQPLPGFLLLPDEESDLREQVAALRGILSRTG